MQQDIKVKYEIFVKFLWKKYVEVYRGGEVHHTFMN